MPTTFSLKNWTIALLIWSFGCAPRKPPVDRESYCREEKAILAEAEADRDQAALKAQESLQRGMASPLDPALRDQWQFDQAIALEQRRAVRDAQALVRSCYDLAADLNNAQAVREHEANRRYWQSVSEGFRPKPTVTCTRIGNVTTCR
jgi:hypothetical protein